MKNNTTQEDLKNQKKKQKLDEDIKKVILPSLRGPIGSDMNNEKIKTWLKKKNIQQK